MTDLEWEAWRAENPFWMEAIRAHLFCEVQRHADVLGSLIHPWRNALAYLDAEYPRDPPGFHERLASDFVANLDKVQKSPLSILYCLAFARKEDDRKEKGEPCPCRWCRNWQGSTGTGKE